MGDNFRCHEDELLILSQPVPHLLFHTLLSYKLSTYLKLKPKMFRLVFYLYNLRFPITLNIRLVHDQMLQKAGTYIHLLAKEPGQPFPEIHADSLSTNVWKKAEMVWWGFIWLVLILQPLLEQGSSSEAAWFFFYPLLQLSAQVPQEWHLNTSSIRYQANKAAPLTKSTFCHLYSSCICFSEGLPCFTYPVTQTVDLSGSTTLST